MDGQDTISTLFRAISDAEVQANLSDQLVELRQALADCFQRFRESNITPRASHQFELRVERIVRETARSFLQWCLSSLETEQTDSMPGTVRYRDKSYRRLSGKTQHENILTRFGNITLAAGGVSARKSRQSDRAAGESSRHRAWSHAGSDGSGRSASRRSRFVPESLREVIADRTGSKSGTRNSESFPPCWPTRWNPSRSLQCEQLQKWIDQAERTAKTLFFRSAAMALVWASPLGYFEMASVATLSVFSEGKRLGTVYMAATPEENQATLSKQLTSLLSGIIRVRGEKLAKIVYVTDAGKVETGYWKNVLRKLYVDGCRIKIERVVDYYHASERLTIIADSLKLSTQQRSEWLGHVRKLLLADGGWGRVMRSIAKMEEIYGVKKAALEESEKAKRYLRRYRRFMNYAEQRGQGCPIGSGIVESACKQIVSERMKLSGMRWKRIGAQHVMSLRSILLSQTWDVDVQTHVRRIFASRRS